MKTVILGHAGADFDCVASMAGLSRLYAGSVPVLPGSLEPNVEEFLRLYEGRFRFVRQPLAHLLQQDIGTVILADTIVPARLGEYRELLSLPHIRLIAYDHHEPSAASLVRIDEGHVARCGATASLVCSALRERQIPVNPEEATLLALGIYEDTGSLLFPETTAFDVEQAAYLLKAGASLSMVARFVTTYLTADQQRVLEDALNTAHERIAGGAQVVIATVHAERNVGNLSVIVHRLAQIIKAEALFLIYEVPGTLYVLGRSDRFLNVAQLLAPLGGAGRIHAAACILHDGTSALEAEERIVSAVAARGNGWRSVVPSMMTTPATTVEHDRLAEEALQIMVHLGLSVLPVEKDGRIVGVIAKKALEKTSLDRLRQKPVHYFMNTRIPVVSMGATVEELLQSFSAYNTGLLLVMEDERLLGVVSRSDILRYLNSAAHLPSLIDAKNTRMISRTDLDRLCGAGTAATLADIGRIGEELENKVYLVGGSIRDILLGRTPNDFDIVAEKDVSGVASAVADHFGTSVISYGRFMTHKVHIHHREYDFAAARVEYYDFPGSLPTVAPASLIKDLVRRDFTVNALAMSLSGPDFGSVVDAVGGLQDLEARVIRITYPDSFIEDPARILRALSIQTRLSFALDAETARKAKEALELGLLNTRRNKRAQEEFKEIISGAGGSTRIAALCKLGCDLIGLPLKPPRAPARRILAALQSTPQSSPALPDAPAWVAPLLLWLGKCPPEELREILKDFGLNDHLAAACSLWQAKERAVRRLLSGRPLHLSDLAQKLSDLPAPIVAIIQARLVTSGAADELTAFKRALDSLEVPPLVTGADIVALGIRPGPRIGRLLEVVRKLQLEGKMATRSDALAYVSTLNG